MLIRNLKNIIDIKNKNNSNKKVKFNNENIIKENFRNNQNISHENNPTKKLEIDQKKV